MILKSPAKINLFLNITGKYPNNYHKIQSFFALLNLHDVIEITESETNSVAMNKEIDGNNIIIKALNFIRNHFGIKQNFNVKITKSIPISAGLGGGSSNAATAIKYICQKFGKTISQNDLNEIAHNLGADIPFFIHNQNALVEGIGEYITPFKLNKTLYLLAVNPNISISTKLIFENRKSIYSKEHQFNTEDIWQECLKAHNDLAETIVNLYPQIELLLSFLKQQNGCFNTGISGSGATCFAIFETADDLMNAYNNIKAKQNWWVHKEDLRV